MTNVQSEGGISRIVRSSSVCVLDTLTMLASSRVVFNVIRNDSSFSNKWSLMMMKSMHCELFPDIDCPDEKESINSPPM